MRWCQTNKIIYQIASEASLHLLPHSLESDVIGSDWLLVSREYTIRCLAFEIKPLRACSTQRAVMWLLNSHIDKSAFMKRQFSMNDNAKQ